MYHVEKNHKNTEIRGKFKRKVPNPIAKSKHIKRIDNNCYFPGLVQTFAYVENGGLILLLKLAKPLTCMKGA